MTMVAIPLVASKAYSTEAVKELKVEKPNVLQSTGSFSFIMDGKYKTVLTA